MTGAKWALSPTTRRLVKSGQLNWTQARWFQRGIHVYGRLPETEQIAIAKDRAHTAAVTHAAKGGFFTRIWRSVKKVATWAYKAAKVVVGVAAFKLGMAHPFLAAISVYGASKVLPFVEHIPVLGSTLKYATLGAGLGAGWAAARGAYGLHKKAKAFKAWWDRPWLSYLDGVGPIGF